MAEAVGVRGIRLERPEDVETGVAEALNHDGPVLVDAVVNRMELAIAAQVMAEMAKGFLALHAESGDGGRANDIVELGQLETCCDEKAVLPGTDRTSVGLRTGRSIRAVPSP